MKKALGLLICAVAVAVLVVDVPSGHAVMGIRAARTALAARRAKQKMTESEKTKKENLQAAEKPASYPRGSADDPTDTARQG